MEGKGWGENREEGTKELSRVGWEEGGKGGWG